MFHFGQKALQAAQIESSNDQPVTRPGVWGELLTQDIKLERPVEYMSEDVNNPTAQVWAFDSMEPGQVKTFLATHGLTREQVDAQVVADRVYLDGTTTLLAPDEDFLLSMTTETRTKLFGSLFGMGIGSTFDNPLVFPNQSIETVYATPGLNPADVALLKKLVYPSDNSWRLTDYQLLMRRIPTVERRIAMTQALSKKPAVLVRLRVGPQSDLEQIADYWGNMENVRFSEVRPMLTALKQTPGGGSVSLMYFLPPFARARLYTYPLPHKSGEPDMDCHWSTFNFSNIEPDNRFNDTKYASEYLTTHFDPVQSPTRYGDVVMFINSSGNIKHSGVFLADDLYFTKYGNRCQQPWMIVHLSDMQAMYPFVKPLYFRRKSM